MGVRIEGTITLADGSTSQFGIYPGDDGGWSQWGAVTERLGRTVEYVQAMEDGLIEADLMVDDEDEE